MDAAAAHSRHLLQQLQEQRIQGLLCDCMLVVKGVCFKAHKNVLAAFSQYFRGLFQNSPGQKNDVFHLDVKTVSGIGQMLDFMYTSRLDLNQDNVQAMLDIAQSLQVQNVLSLCHTFLKSAGLDLPPGTPCPATSFPLQRALTPEAHCAGGEGYPHLLQEGPGDAQPGRVQDAVVTLPQSPGETARPAPEASDGSGSELPARPPSYYHKLRNLYSKQHSKPAACPGHDRVPEQPFALSASSDLSAAGHQPGAPSHSHCVLEAAEHLPANFLAQPVAEPAPAPASAGACQPPARQMRLKKAVHLRKLNFLKSQRSAARAPEAQPEDSLAEGGGSAGDRAAERLGSRRAEERASQELAAPESSHAASEEVERAEDPEGLGDPAQALPAQRQYTCESCGKPFKHPSNLELHRRAHTGERPFECSVCGKHFSQAGNLQTHLRRHSGEKPYICEVCGKRFAASGDVQRHIIIHSGEKPHLCDVCGRGFSNFSNLKEHRKTHTADKVFTCDQCGKSFNMQRKLVKHRVRHTGERPYSCSACGKGFGGSGDLRRHVRTHTGERPYGCEICGKSFSRSAVLRRHRGMHCSAGGQGPPGALAELARAAEAPDPAAARGAEAFARDVAGELPGRPGHQDAATFDGKFRAPAPAHAAREPDQPAAPPAPAPHQAYAYVDAVAGDEPLPADVAMMRSPLAALEGPCGEALGGRAAPAAFRSPEGQFFSSMSLWGLAMKTLQNEGELDQ